MARIEDIYPGWGDRDTAIGDDTMLIEAKAGIKKRMKFDASSISPKTTRALKMPDADVDLAAMLQDIADLQAAPTSFAALERYNPAPNSFSGFIDFDTEEQAGSGDVVWNSANLRFDVVNDGTYQWWLAVTISSLGALVEDKNVRMQINGDFSTIDILEVHVHSTGASLSQSTMAMYERPLSAGDQLTFVGGGGGQTFVARRFTIKRLF